MLEVPSALGPLPRRPLGAVHWGARVQPHPPRILQPVDAAPLGRPFTTPLPPPLLQAAGSRASGCPGPSTSTSDSSTRRRTRHAPTTAPWCAVHAVHAALCMLLRSACRALWRPLVPASSIAPSPSPHLLTHPPTHPHMHTLHTHTTPTQTCVRIPLVGRCGCGARAPPPTSPSRNTAPSWPTSTGRRRCVGNILQCVGEYSHLAGAGGAPGVCLGVLHGGYWLLFGGQRAPAGRLPPGAGGEACQLQGGGSHLSAGVCWLACSGRPSLYKPRPL